MIRADRENAITAQGELNWIGGGVQRIWILGGGKSRNQRTNTFSTQKQTP
jgi:hypothetical protein